MNKRFSRSKLVKCICTELIQGISLSKKKIEHPHTHTKTHTHTHARTHALPQCTLQSKASALSQASSLPPHLLFSPLSFSFFVSCAPSVSVEALTAQSGSQRRSGAPALCLPSPSLRGKSPFFLSFFLSFFQSLFLSFSSAPSL